MGIFMNVIVCVDRHWGIGMQNELLVQIPADHRFFREKTMGGVVLGGRRTMEGLPGKKALAGRENIVLSRQEGYQYEGARVVHSVDEALRILSDYKDREVYIIGGGEIYQEFLPFCSYAYVTKVDASFQADVFFPDLDENAEWECIRSSEAGEYTGLQYRFWEYRRKKA